MFEPTYPHDIHMLGQSRTQDFRMFGPTCAQVIHMFGATYAQVIHMFDQRVHKTFALFLFARLQST
jgi:hypothetical protein